MKKISFLLIFVILLTSVSHIFAGGGYVTKAVLVSCSEEDAETLEFATGMRLDNAGFDDFDLEREGKKVTVTVRHGEKTDYAVFLGMLLADSRIYFRDGEGNTVLFNEFLTADVVQDAHGSCAVKLVLSEQTVERLKKAIEKTKKTGEDNFIKIEINGITLSEPLADDIKGKNEVIVANYLGKEGAQKLVSYIMAAKTGFIADGGAAVNLLPENVMSDWALDEITRAYTFGIADISEEYNFKAPITREAFCELAYELIEDAGSKEYKSRFTDTDNPKIAALNSLGIIEGKSESVFSPLDTITREEAATIMYRMYKDLGLDELLGVYDFEKMEYRFKDDEKISGFAKEAVYNMYARWVFGGVGEDYFAPLASYTTEQATVTVLRLWDIKEMAESKAKAESEGLIYEEAVITD